MRITIPLRNRITQCVLALSLCALYTITQAQDVPKINIPTSPEAALLGKFGDIPVGYYTGTADVSVPLYTIKEGAVEIPISLRYYGGGIKVEDQATWVGLGWDLTPEGAIVQEVRGKSDNDDYAGITCDNGYQLFEQRYSFMTDDMYMFLPQWGRATAPNACENNPNEGHEESYCVVDHLLRGYGQPDIYSYSFNGQSGKFYINPKTKEIVVTEKNDQVYFQILDTLITATTLDGTVYSFGAVESAHGGIVNEYVGKTYKLSSIKLLNGRTVNFTYTTNTYTEQAVTQSAVINEFGPSGDPNPNFTTTYHTKKTLVKITTTDAIIDFVLSSRDDINAQTSDNLQKLSTINITSRLNNVKIKSIQFYHTYFPYDWTGVINLPFLNTRPEAYGKRLKLDSLKETGYDDAGQAVNKPAYKFEYNMSVVMPMKVSFAKDFWGYYNGASNSTLLPNLEYFDYFTQPEYRAINMTLNYPYAGGNRYTDNTKAGAYMLTKISYPTGGYSQFEYEPNTFSNQFIPDQSTPFNKNYYVDDNAVNSSPVQTFKLSKSTLIHFENRMVNGRGNPNGITPYTYGQMADCYINLSKIKTVNGSPVTTTLKQWDLSTVYTVDFETNGGKTWIEDLRIDYDGDPTVQYKLSVYFPDNLNNPIMYGAGVSSHITYSDNTGVDVSVSKQCGLRIKSIKNYTEPGKLASHKLYTYAEGKLLNRFRPLTVYNCNQHDETFITNGVVLEYMAFYRRITVNGNNFGTNGGNLIGYGKVEETELVNGTATSGKKVFYYLNEENKTQQDCPNIPNLQNGLISMEEIYNSANEKLLQRNYNYTWMQPFATRYIGVSVVRLSTGSKVPCNNLYELNPPVIMAYYDNNNQPYVGSQYGYNLYPIKAAWYKPGVITTQEMSGGVTLSKTEKYTYNTEGSIRSLTVFNSKGDSLVTKYYYPNDNKIAPAIDTVMTKLHNTGTPVITEQYINTTLLTRDRAKYGSFATINTLLPQYIYHQKGTNAEELRVTIDSYDDRGNVTQYTEANNMPVSFVWNTDKTLPIAKIENATYASVLGLPGGLGPNARTLLPNARITTFTYKPLIGVSTITDPNSRVTTYEYDGLGRLLWVKDHDGNIIKTFDYHYKQ